MFYVVGFVFFVVVLFYFVLFELAADSTQYSFSFLSGSADSIDSSTTSGVASISRSGREVIAVSVVR